MRRNRFNCGETVKHSRMTLKLSTLQALYYYFQWRRYCLGRRYPL